MNWLPGISAAVLLLSALLGQAADPMTFQELSLRLRMGDSPQLLLQETRQRSLLEGLTQSQEALLQNSGASADWLAALRSPDLRTPPEAAAAYRARKDRQQTAANAAPPPLPAAAPTKSTAENLHEADIIKIGDKSPTFTAKTADGKEVAINPAGNKGRLTLLVIVAPKSAPCDEALKIVEKHFWPGMSGAGAAVVALGTGQTASEMADVGKRLGLTITLAEDPRKEITALFARDYAPRCYVIGKTGVIKYASVGLNAEDLQRMANIVQSEFK